LMLELGKKEGVEVIPGIELTLPALGHTLLYYPTHELLGEHLENGYLDSQIRNLINELGLEGILTEYYRLGGLQSVAHCGELDVLVGLHRKDQLKLYARVVGLLKPYEGVVIKSHIFPCFGLDLLKDYLIEGFQEAGLAGFEVDHPRSALEHVRELKGILGESTLILTGGSDAHVPSEVGEIELWEYRMTEHPICIGYRVVEQLKEAKRKLHDGKEVDFETGKVVE